MKLTIETTDIKEMNFDGDTIEIELEFKTPFRGVRKTFLDLCDGELQGKIRDEHGAYIQETIDILLSEQERNREITKEDFFHYLDLYDHKTIKVKNFDRQHKAMVALQDILAELIVSAQENNEIVQIDSMVHDAQFSHEQAIRMTLPDILKGKQH